MFTALIAFFFDDAMLLDSTVRSTLPHYRNTGLRLLQRYREPMQIMSFVCSEKKGSYQLLVACQQDVYLSSVTKNSRQQCSPGLHQDYGTGFCAAANQICNAMQDRAYQRLISVLFASALVTQLASQRMLWPTCTVTLVCRYFDAQPTLQKLPKKPPATTLAVVMEPVE